MTITTAAALLSGACNAGLIALVTYALNHPNVSLGAMAWGFAALAVGKLATNAFSQIMLAQYCQGAIADIRKDLVQKILSVPLRKIEALGTPRLMVALTEDVLNITQALLAIPNFTVNIAILCGGALYLGWLSWKVSLMMFGFIVVGGIGYRWMIVKGFSYLALAREEEDKLFGHFRSLTDGIKELKLHRNRRSKFLSDNLQTTMERFLKHNVAAEVRFIVAHGWSHFLFFAMIGVILFALPVIQHITPQALTGYVVTTLYLMGPLAGVLSSQSVFGRANVSLRKIEELGVTLSSDSKETCSVTQPEDGACFETLELRGVTHSYHREEDDNHFILGPINLVFRPGELVYLVGGNGSGKSSLAKIITGLYPPEAGEVLLDGELITDQTRDDYRQLFSTVFADFFVFDTLLGLEQKDIDGKAREYLTQLHLHHKVKVRNGAFSTTALSTGQRKRLALLTAYMEDRPFYLFDEWASDQDPTFKEVFYRKLLPDLKSRGKTVLVITHDDRYFHLADRIVKMDYGQLVYDKRTEGREVESESVLTQ